MRKVIATINMTLDGYCDHTALLPDEEIHHHFAELLKGADVVLYGRKTFQLMTYWRDLLKNPSGEKSMDDFAVVMDNVPKVVFSNTLKNTDWSSAKLSNQTLEETVSALKKDGDGKDILLGSRSIIHQLMRLNLIDEYQICVHPVIAGGGLPLFSNDRTELKLKKTKIFGGGAVVLYYERKN
ncbi:MAG: dihydrofolate reductase family protein [Cryomorphaceae bacterium]|nr:dihydrofolate reductase family protein [Cryomorphaceae bacterium]